MFILLFVFILETFFPYKTRFFSFDSDFADAISKPTIKHIQNIQNNSLEENRVKNRVQKKTILFLRDDKIPKKVLVARMKKLKLLEELVLLTFS
jgi:hypothetical protein